jgi:hypothetical protein
MTEKSGQIFKALCELLEKLSDAQIQNVVSRSGVRITNTHPAYIAPSTDRKQEVLNQVRIAFDREKQRSQNAAMSILGDMAIGLIEQVGAEALQDALRHHGFNLLHDRFLPLDVLDLRSLCNVPAVCHDDLKTAAFRIAGQDYTGAITSACGAVDTLTNAAIERDNVPVRQWNKPSFSSKVNTVLFKHLRVHEEIRDNLIAEATSPADAKDAANRIRGETNKAAQRLRELRPGKSDVHGRKAADHDTACEAIALSLEICRLFNGKL